MMLSVEKLKKIIKLYPESHSTIYMIRMMAKLVPDDNELSRKQISKRVTKLISTEV